MKDAMLKAMGAMLGGGERGGSVAGLRNLV